MKLLKRQSVLLLLVVGLCLAAPSVSLSAVTDLDARVLRLEQWMKAVLHHQPGTPDESARTIASWSIDELDALAIEEGVLIDLTQKIETLSRRSPVILAGYRRIPYSALQLHRLQVLACAAAGVLTDRTCLELHAAEELDPELTELADRAAAARRRGDANDFVRRGALLHTDIALAGPLQPQTQSTGASDGLLVRAFDGQQIDFEARGPHWLMARALLDAVRPGHDAMVRAWYVATGTWMQQQLIADSTHLTHGRTLFPEAAELWFLSGCQHERLATPAVQTLAHTSVLPQGVALDIGSERSELKDAETLFRRATTLDPSHTDAHLRLGHVLLTRGQFKEAAHELQLALTASSDPLVQYFASLSLGAAQEGFNQVEQARHSYHHATELYPAAQSPRLALSALAWRRGERATALDEIQPVSNPSRIAAASRADDPWWDYYVLPERKVDMLFAELWRPFLLGVTR